MLTDRDILEALRACFDPGNPFGKPVDIVDLGCVDTIALAPDPEAPGANIPGVPPRQRLHLTLTPCSPEEDARTQLRAQLENRLAGLPELSRTTIEWSQQPWTLERIAPQVLARLQPQPTPFAILNNRQA